MSSHLGGKKRGEGGGARDAGLAKLLKVVLDKSWYTMVKGVISAHKRYSIIILLRTYKYLTNVVIIAEVRINVQIFTIITTRITITISSLIDTTAKSIS
jgi:hypothetical protein